MKKKVAIIACAMALPGEKGYSRFAYLANMMANNGFKVDLYTSTFNHWEKAQRSKEKVNAIRKEVPYKIFLGFEPGYRKNVDPRRVVSHLKLSKSILSIIDRENAKKRYDLLYCVIPDNNLAAKVTEYGKKKHIPVIVDIEDLWPEGMKLAFNLPVISDVVFSPFSSLAKKAYRDASAYVGTSDEFRDEPLKYKEGTGKYRITVYVGCDLDDFDAGVEKYAPGIVKGEDEFWVIYTGTLGSSYDIGTLVKAAQEIKSKGIENIKIKLLGSGPLEGDFKKIAEEKPCNVEFLGYQPYEKMAAYISKSDVTVNSFVKCAPQSIVNKVGDYLAGGKPMINTLTSPEFRKKVEDDGFGINVWAENEKSLAEAILEFYNNPEKCLHCGELARKIAEEQFDRKNSYKKIIDLINKNINKK